MKNRILASASVLALLLTLVPVTAFAADVTGNVTSNNNAPVVNSITIAAMTPGVAHSLDISITDDNTLADIAQIDIWIFYDADGGDNGTPGAAWDCDEEAIYKWVEGGSTWSMEDGALEPSNHTWALGTGSAPTMTNTTGTWTLDFTPGKLAVEAVGGTLTNPEWDVKVTVTDGTAADSLTVYSTAMTAYSSITTDVGVTPITFGAGVALGATAYIDTPVDHNFATQVLSNDTYALKVNTAATWTGAGTLTLDPSGTPDAAGEFALNIDDGGDGAGIPTVPQPVTTSAATITGLDAVSRVATLDGVAEAAASKDLFMSLKLFTTGIAVEAYSGAITLTVVN